MLDGISGSFLLFVYYTLRNAKFSIITQNSQNALTNTHYAL